MTPRLYPFTLKFKNNDACFPFIREGKPVASIGNNPAPSCLVSGREAGDMSFSNSELNRNNFFRLRGIPADKVYSLFQVHSRDVFTVGDPVKPDSPLPAPKEFACEGDGMVSFSAKAALAVTVADCLPVFLLDTENGYFALLHSGWKGTGIAAHAMEIMQRAGTRPEAVAAVLGPCIQSCCYRVDEERARQFKAEFGSSLPQVGASDCYPLGAVIRADITGCYINLQAANARLLAAAGVRNIAYCTDCTCTDTRLGSFRREGPENFTKMMAVLVPYSPLSFNPETIST